MENFILGSLLDETGLQWTGEHHWCMFWCDNCNHQCSPSGGWSVAASELVLVVTGACRLSWSYSTPALIVVDRTEPGEDRVTTSHLTPQTSNLTPHSADHDQPALQHFRALNISQASVSTYITFVGRFS